MSETQDIVRFSCTTPGCTDCEQDTADPGSSGETCPHSQWEGCKHHCNHSWSHDSCCWCQRTWGMADWTEMHR